MKHAYAASLTLLLALHTGGAIASQDSVEQRTKAALALMAHPADGARLYAAHCSSCHGSRAQGAANLELPVLAGQRVAYLVHQLAGFVDDARNGDDMHRGLAATELQEPQAWIDLAAFLHRAAPPWRRGVGDGTQLRLGRSIFTRQCASCHRDDARGDDDGYVPSLRNQHYTYLANQLTLLPKDARHDVDERLLRFFGSFNSDEVSAVADYLARLRDPAPGASGNRRAPPPAH